MALLSSVPGTAFASATRVRRLLSICNSLFLLLCFRGLPLALFEIQFSCAIDLSGFTYRARHVFPPQKKRRYKRTKITALKNCKRSKGTHKTSILRSEHFAYLPGGS